MHPETTVCILSYMRHKRLAECLQSIRDAGDQCRIVVLDSSPKPDLFIGAEIAQRHGAMFIGWPEPVTCNYGRRELLSYVNTPWMVYLDDDMMVEDGWLGRMHKLVDEFTADIAVMRWVNTTDGAQISGGRLLVNGFTKICPYDYIGEVKFCAGGATLYRTEKIMATSYRHEYSGCGEDHDQTLQMHYMGARCIHTDVTCLHIHADNTKPFKQQRFRNGDIINAQIALGIQHGIYHQYINAISRAVSGGYKLNGEQKRRIAEGMCQWLQEL